MRREIYVSGSFYFTDWQVRRLANEDNLKGHGFHERTAREQRDIAKKGGKASGETRRRKADFRKTMNLLLTSEIDSPEWTPVLESLGLDSTLEAAVNMAMIKEALEGNVKAYMAIKDVLGQTSKSDADLEEQNVRTRAMRAKMDTGNNVEFESDGFLEALKGQVKETFQDMEGIVDE